MDDYTSTTTTNRRRRRALTWGLFGMTGILMSAAWATGFATGDTGIGAVGDDNTVLGATGASETQSAYQGLVTAHGVDGDGNLLIDFLDDGEWGEIPGDTVMFSVDLTDADLVGETFYTDIYLSNTPTGWAAGPQIIWQAAVDTECAAGTPMTFDASAGVPAEYTATVADYAAETPIVSTDLAKGRMMNITETDARVSFTGLAGGSLYCFGVAQTIKDADDAYPQADDIHGTFLRRVAGATVEFPEFTAIVNREA